MPQAGCKLWVRRLKKKLRFPDNAAELLSLTELVNDVLIF